MKEALNVGNGKQRRNTRKCAHEEHQRKYWPTNDTNELVHTVDVWASWGAQGNGVDDTIRGRRRVVNECEVL